LALNPYAVTVAAVTLAIVYLTPQTINRFLPSQLLALVLGSLLVFFWLTAVPVLGEIPTGLPEARLPKFELAVVPDMVRAALVLALLGSIDSLLTSLIADNLTQSYHDSDRELIGQGIGNTLAGLFGAIPGAGATMRTVVNVRTGGKTPISGALHAVVLLAIVLGVGGLAANIPQAVLAGILIKVGVDIIDWAYLQRLKTAPKAGVFFMLVVLLLTVFVDLITAVGVGIVLASLLFVKRMSDLQLANIQEITNGSQHSDLAEDEMALLEAAEGRVVLYQLTGPFSFGAARGMARRLGAADAYDALVLDLSGVPFLDSSASLSLEDAIRNAEAQNKLVWLVGLQAPVRQVLGKLGVEKILPADHILDSRREALIRARDAVAAARNTSQT
jgi:SulP family sulfate permease